MDVEILPNTFNREEYGFILGKVTSIANYPASEQRLHNTLRNDTLIEEVTHNNIVLEITVELILDKNTHSGYAWTLSDGPRYHIDSGTQCRAWFIERQRPIERIRSVIAKSDSTTGASTP